MFRTIRSVALVAAFLAMGSTPSMSAEVERVCFVPGEDCTGMIVRAIGQAQREILVQAYSFTSKDIGSALADARKRGVDVRVIVDGSELHQRGSEAPWLVRQGVPVLVDAPHGGIAHNKTMVLDGARVITGSFNFTVAAQERNAENTLILSGVDVANLYKANWRRRAAVATPMD